ncbi:hypothetical protein R6Q57_001137 [Mikania cordata]
MYSGNRVMDCNTTDETGPSLAFLYTCNGLKPTCPSFLVFRTQPQYNTVLTISKLMSLDHGSLARINNIIDYNKILPLNKELIIPVNCSCVGEYYQANTSFVIPTIYDTYFTIANLTYQGLTTCSSLMRNNIYGQYDLHPGQMLQVPLRCACPTVSQTAVGARYLLTYLITWKDSIKKISKRFKVSSQDLALANGFSSVGENDIYPFTTFLVPLSNEPISSMTRTLGHKQNLSKKWIMIGTMTGSFLAILYGFSMGYFLWRRNLSTRGKTVIKSALPEDIQLGIASVDQSFKIYRYEELEQASDGFSLENKLSSSVYKGGLKAKTVAIKQMGSNAKKEVKILKKFNHFNLIGLYGVCEHDRSCFLVYEFMENGSLKEWLEDKTLTFQESQSWTNRIRVGLDVAKGLQYLHNFASPAYVHKDINSSNILLSKDLRAKISNFGFARSTEKDQNGNSSIKCSLESKGYHAPEYVESGTVTTKTDVYAFGVVLLELITGKKAVYNDDDGVEVMLSENMISCMSDEEHAKDKVNSLIDPRLHARHPVGFIIDHSELALRLVKLAVACLEPEPSRRLSMNEIVSTLMMIQMDTQSSETIMYTV